MTDPNPLSRFRHQHLTLDDLVEAAGLLLRRLDVRSDDGRVSAAPDERGVRYYQTLGVVDKPLRYDGRRAIYGYRHLLQLLAVKRLQQEGNPLHLIQQTLAGRSTDALEHALQAMLGGTTPPAPLRTLGPSDLRPSTSSGRPERAQRVEGQPPALRQAHAAPTEHSESRGGPPTTALLATRLAPGITVVIDPGIVEDPSALISAFTECLHTRRKEH